jgi:hypothetical protein
VYESRMHEHTISLRFLDIILRVLRLDVEDNRIFSVFTVSFNLVLVSFCTIYSTFLPPVRQHSV